MCWESRRVPPGGGGGRKNSIFLFLSVPLLNNRELERDMAIKPFGLKNNVFEQGKFEVVHPRST